jgi:hypothetical protein
MPPIGTGVSKYFEKVPHRCKDKSFSLELNKKEKPGDNKIS